MPELTLDTGLLADTTNPAQFTIKLDLAAVATPSQLDPLERKNQKGVAGGYAPLGADKLVPAEFLPAATGGSSTSNLPFFDIRSYGAATSNANNASAIQAAINAAENAGGGTVWIPAGVWNTGPLVLANRVWVRGAGMYATQLRLINGANATFITLRQFVSGTSNNAQFTALLDLTLDGNLSNQTSGDGIYHAQSPAFGQAATDLFVDPRHLIQNVLLHRIKGNGFVGQDGRSETRLINVFTFYCGGYGFKPSPDTSLVACNAGAMGKQGFYITSSSVRLEGCKAFYCGDSAFGTETLGIGFHLDGARGVHITNCEAQDNKCEGLVVNGYSWNNNISMVLDSNSKRGKGLHAAFKLGPGYANTLSLTCYERNDPALASTDANFCPQQNAIQFDNAADAFNNKISLTHQKGSGVVTLGPPVHPTGNTLDNVSGNTLEINNQLGMVSSSYASTITPIPYSGGVKLFTLTGNMSINATTQHHAGAEMTFVFTQDATGGRTVTFASQYKVVWSPNTTAGKVNIITFRFNGTSWLQVSATVGV